VKRSAPVPAAFLISILGILLVVSCATNPVTGKRGFSLMGEGQEIQLGQEMDKEVRQEMGLYDDQELQQYVEGIGQRLAKVGQRPGLPWHFAVVDVAAVNAFALPGGYIYITRGILPFLDNEAQLAGVIGHEIGHVNARHAAEQYSRSVGGNLALATLGVFVPATRQFGNAAGAAMGVLFLKYSRDDEIQADELGVQYAAEAGWDPRGVPEMLTTLGRLDEASDRNGIPNWLSTHPQPADRVERVEATVKSVEGERRQWTVDRAAYLQQIDGIIYGEDPSKGVIRGNEFLHPDLRFALTFPEGWTIQNGAAQVVAKAPDADWYVLLQIVKDPLGRTASDIAASDMSRAGFSRLSGSATTIGGMEAYAGTYEGTLQDAGKMRAYAAHVVDGTHVYLIAGLAPPDQYERVEAAFGAAVRSFRRLSDERAASIKPDRVQIVTVRAGDTWESLAKRSGGTLKAATLAIMNDHDPGDAPTPGERIKIVVSG
jgi:predicted Zn-dependent protease